MADNKDRADPYGSYYFELQIGKINCAQFMECSGLKTSTTVFEIEEGGINHMVHKLPGQSRYENIILKFGVTASTDLLEWRNKILLDEWDDDNKETGAKRSGAIILKNNHGEELMRWEFVDAWPVSYEGPSFNSASNDLAINTFELAHHGLSISTA